jgi:hypothetical protein
MSSNVAPWSIRRVRGHRRSKNGVASLAYAPRILAASRLDGLPDRDPAMTN